MLWLVILLRIVTAIIVGLVALLMWALARLELDLEEDWTGIAIAAIVVGVGAAILVLDFLWFLGDL